MSDCTQTTESGADAESNIPAMQQTLQSVHLKHVWELGGLMVKLGKLTLNHVLDEHASFGNLLVDLEFLVVGS
jgi:hypothetical protein